MHLNFDDQPVPMKVVYVLADELKKKPELIAQIQALTLNQDKPRMGLKGTHGLYGSEAWWQSIREGRSKVQRVSGVIEELFFAGQDSRWGDQVNSFRMRLDDGSLLSESIYATNKADRKLFRVGARLAVAYVLEELKQQPARDGGVNYLKEVLEMALSVGDPT